MAELECPPYAIAVWLEPDQLMIRFPDRQLISIPADEPRRLLIMLEGILRERTRNADIRPGTKAAPVQYDVDKIAEALQRQAVNKTGHEIRAADEARRERERRAVLKRDAKRRAKEEAEEFLKEIGL